MFVVAEADTVLQWVQGGGIRLVRTSRRQCKNCNAGCGVASCCKWKLNPNSLALTRNHGCVTASDSCTSTVRGSLAPSCYTLFTPNPRQTWTPASRGDLPAHQALSHMKETVGRELHRQITDRGVPGSVRARVTAGSVALAADVKSLLQAADSQDATSWSRWGRGLVGWQDWFC